MGSGEGKIRVLIVDDSAVVRQTMQEILESDPEITVIGTAQDPFVAADIIAEVIPDVITLDIEMPKMDGLTFLQRIMRQHPIPVVICSSRVGEGAAETLAALDHGAVDIIFKPRVGAKRYLIESRILLCDAVKAAALVDVRSCRHGGAPISKKLNADVMLPPPTFQEAVSVTEPVVVVGASTGGTMAIRRLLQSLSADCFGMVIVQHMPKGFTNAFARRLDRECPMTVKEAVTGDRVVRGTALIAPGDDHILLKRIDDEYVVEVKYGPLVCRHRPSVDVLFRSTSRYAGKNAIGVLLTGMGDDGAQGMLEMRQGGAFTIAQDETSCVVFGMPKEAIRINAAHEVLPLERIGERIQTCLRRARD